MPNRRTGKREAAEPLSSPGIDPHPIAGRIEPLQPLPPEGPPPGLAASPDMGSLLRALRRRWLAAFTLGLLLAVTAGASAYSLLSPSFTAFAQIRVLPYSPSTLGQSLEQSAAPQMYMKSQGALLKSRPVLQAALKREEVKRLGLENKHAEPITYLEKNITVETTENSDLLTVKFAAEEPGQAVTLLKAISDSYMDYLGYGEKTGRVQRVAELEKVYNETNESIKTKKANLKKLADNLGTMDKESMARQREELISNARDLRTQRISMRGELTNAQSALDSWEMRVKAMQNLELNESALEASLEADPQGRLMMSKIDRLKIIVRDFEDRSPRRDEPTYIRSARMLQNNEADLAKRREDLRVELKVRTLARAKQEHQLAKIELTHKIDSLTEQLKRLDGEIQNHITQLAKLTIPSNDFESQTQQIQLEEKSAGEIGDKLQKLRIDLRSPDRITLHQEAELQAADSKKQQLATVASPVGMLVLVCLGVAWSDCRKRRIHSAGEVAQGLRMRVVGAIPDFPHLERHVLDMDGELALDGRGVVEAIDAVRTLVLHDAETEGTHILLVTSAGGGEGKTTLAGHLAGSLARAGRRTLLIDGDLRRPCLHELFGTPLQPGLSEVLLGEADLDDSLQWTGQENLALMPAGQWDREVIHALARGGLNELFLRLRQEFDFLIIDSHPVLEATDALLIGRHVDAALVTVLRQVSKMPQVYLAQQRLHSIGVPVLGVVVNGSDPNEVVLPTNPAQVGQMAAA